MELGVPIWNIQNGPLPREIGPQPAPPIPPTPTPQLRFNWCRPMAGSEKTRAKVTQKQHPSAAPGPCCPKGFPRLCSLSLVICVFVCDFGYGKPRKSRRTASTDGGSLLGKTGLALQMGAILRVLAAAGNLPPQDLTLTPKRDPKSAPRAPKRTFKNGIIDTGQPN